MTEHRGHTPAETARQYYLVAPDALMQLPHRPSADTHHALLNDQEAAIASDIIENRIDPDNAPEVWKVLEPYVEYFRSMGRVAVVLCGNMRHTLPPDADGRSRGLLTPYYSIVTLWPKPKPAEKHQ